MPDENNSGGQLQGFLQQMFGQNQQQQDQPLGPQPGTPGTSQQNPWETQPSTPGLTDVAAGAYFDYGRANETNRFNFNRREQGLADFSGQIGDFMSRGYAGVEGDVDRTRAVMEGNARLALGDVRGGAAGAQGYLEQGVGEMQGANQFGQEQLSAGVEGVQDAIGTAQLFNQENQASFATALSGLHQQQTDFLSQLGLDRDMNDEMVATAWEKGAEAMGNFKSQMADQMTSWSTGHMQQTAQMKEQRAAELSAQGYRPDEIQQELSRLDMQAAQTQAKQVADFGIQEETSRRQLEAHYTGLGMQTMAHAQSLNTQLTGMESQFRQTMGGLSTQISQMQAASNSWAGDVTMEGQQTIAGLRGQKASLRAETGSQIAQMRQLQGSVEQWRGSMTSQIRIGAAQAQGAAIMAGAQMQSTQNAMALQGYASLQQMYQSNQDTFTPLAPVLSNLMSIGMGLEDRMMTTEGGGLALMMNGLNFFTGQGNAALAGMAQTVRMS
jgi:hypothetical protein